MKIGINASFINLHSGIGTYVRNLVDCLTAENYGIDFSYYLSRLSYAPAYFNNVDAGVHTFPVPEYNSLHKSMWEQFRLPRIIENHKLDAFHSPAFIAPLRLKIPSVVTVHDLVFLRHPETLLLKKRLYYKYMMSRSIRNASRIITVSEYVKREIVQNFGIPSERITVVYHGIDDEFRPSHNEEPDRTVQAKYNIRMPFFLFVGAIEPRKNLERIVRAFALLRNTDTQLVIAGGKGWKYDTLYAAVRELNLSRRIVFTDTVSREDLASLYNACLALVLPSIYEGFGLPLAEAMACGTPVVTSKDSAMSEVCGEAALLVDPFETDDIASAMDTIISDGGLRKRLSEKGLRRAELFSWKKCADSIVDVYRSVI